MSLGAQDQHGRFKSRINMEGQNPIPIAVLLALGVFFLYLHFTNGSGVLRLWLALALVVAGVVLLIPSFKLNLPGPLEALANLPKIELGLDLQGGTHLLLEVKLEEAVKTALKRRGDDLKRELQTNKLDLASITQQKDGSLLVALKNAEERTPFLDLMSRVSPDLTLSTAESAAGPAYSLNFTPREVLQVQNNAMDQALETIRNRIDQLGVRETTVVKEGDNDILVQLPGIQDPERAKELIGKTAVLEFKIVDDKHTLADAQRDGSPPGDQILYGSPQAGGAEPYLVEEPTVGPSLGRDSIRQGELSFIVGALAVLAFMAFYYSGAGVLADFGLSLNILLLVCVMAALDATLTLPGIAGIVLTLGMSVDANVLVNERMREELRSGKSPREAVKAGYERAWNAIRDSNISTFVAGVILFQFGTGPVKGFAVTLCVGVLTGVFSCFVVTRAWYDYKISVRRLNAISV